MAFFLVDLVNQLVLPVWLVGELIGVCSLDIDVGILVGIVVGGCYRTVAVNFDIVIYGTLMKAGIIIPPA